MNTQQRNQQKNATPIAFTFENNAVRIVPNAKKPLFVAKDVAVALGYENTNDAINKFCKGVANRYPLSTQGGKQKIRVIEEPDVYRLVFGSKLDSAEKFQDWVFEEVLPSIRKTGAYVSPASPVYERNQQHSLRLKLLLALEKADNKAVRESIYQSLSEVSNDLSLPLLPLNDFNWAGASVREDAYSVCERFFSAVEALSIIDGVEINHTNHPDQLAVQLSEIIRLGKQYEIDVPKRMELIRYLPYSQAPQFIKRKIVCSGIRRNKKGAALAVRCWLFSRD